MKILFLTHRLPYPPDRGDRIRSYHILSHLARRHQIALASVAEEAAEQQHINVLKKLCMSVDIACLNNRWQKIKSLFYFPTLTPLTLPFFYIKILQQKIDCLLHQQKFDLIFIYCSAMAPYVLKIKHIPKVIDFVDADSEKWFDYAHYSQLPMKFIYWREGLLLRRYEKQIAQNCRHAFVVSQREAEIFKEFLPAIPITTIPNGVTVPKLNRNSEGTYKLVFTGVMDYWPNVDAVTYFVKEIFPIVRNQVPQAEFIIVGKNPTPQVKHLAKERGIKVTGWVPDVREYLAQASVCVVPLRIARGIQNKILEAMAARVPVVATSAATAGIEAVPGRDFLLADEPRQFAGHVIALLLSREKRRQLADNAFKFIRQRHNWEKNLEKMEKILISSASNGSR